MVDSVIEQAVTLVSQELPTIVGMYLFGSYGTAYERTDSDIDLAVLPVTPINPATLWQLAQRIAVIGKRNVDLIDLSNASTVFRFHIISVGQRIYCNDLLACELFETIVYSAYVRFNEERKELLQDIQRRGRIFNG